MQVAKGPERDLRSGEQGDLHLLLRALNRLSQAVREGLGSKLLVLKVAYKV